MPRNLATVFVLFLFITFLNFIFVTNNNKVQQVSTQTDVISIWNKQLTDSFGDEPRFDSFTISSHTGWFVPPDPYVLRPKDIPEDSTVDALLKFASRGSNTPVLSVKEIDNIWTNGNPNKEDLEKFVKDNDLPELFLRYFYAETRMPLRVWNEDVTGDGAMDQVFSSVGVGCISCHTNFIDIFVADKGVFSTETNEGTFQPRADKRGFYLDAGYTGNNYATCCPDNFVISKYEWNGNGFTEIARKTIEVSRKEMN